MATGKKAAPKIKAAAKKVEETPAGNLPQPEAPGVEAPVASASGASNGDVAGAAEVETHDNTEEAPVVARLQVTSRRPGFRRAGRAWSTSPTIVSADEFTPEQIEQLMAEPVLTVLPVADE